VGRRDVEPVEGEQSRRDRRDRIGDSETAEDRNHGADASQAQSDDRKELRIGDEEEDG
jgi:hypothetical protein